MKTQKLYFMFFAATVAVVSFASLAKAELHRILVHPHAKTSRMPASKAEVKDDFYQGLKAVAPEQEEDDEDAAEEATDRAPASATKKVNKANKSDQANGTEERKSRLPSSVEDGFELRVQYGKIVSTFWVVKRGEKYDLVYANSTGSKASRGIASDSFNYLKSTAQDIPKYNGKIASCKDASMQLHILSSGRERSITTCVHDKHKVAEEVRNLGNMLSTMVR